MTLIPMPFLMHFWRGWWLLYCATSVGRSFHVFLTLWGHDWWRHNLVSDLGLSSFYLCPWVGSLLSIWYIMWKTCSISIIVRIHFRVVRFKYFSLSLYVLCLRCERSLVALCWTFSISNKKSIFHSGCHIELKHFKIGLTRDLYKSLELRLLSFDKVLYKSPTLKLISATHLFMWRGNSSDGSKFIPTPISVVSVHSAVPHRVYLCLGMCLQKCKHFHLTTFSGSCHAINHCNNLSVSFWIYHKLFYGFEFFCIISK